MGYSLLIWLTCDQGSTRLGYIPVPLDVVSTAIRALDGHDGWKFMVAASALFHTASRLFTATDGRIEQLSTLRRSRQYLMCYGSPLDGEGPAPFASTIHEIDWVFGSVCNARSLVLQCLVTRQVHVETHGLPISIAMCLVPDILNIREAPNSASSLTGSHVRITKTHEPEAV